MLVKASGILRHYFHGDYSAGVGLVFTSAELAACALPKLGDGWKVVSTKPTVLVWRGEREALDAMKARLRGDGFTLTINPCEWSHCKKKCADAEIDGVPHSIDYGPAFSLAIECDDPNQLHLL